MTNVPTKEVNMIRKTSNGSANATHRDRVYLIEPTNAHLELRPHLVRTNHRSHALAFVSQALFTVRAATPDDMEKYLQEGMRVERYVPRSEREDMTTQTPLPLERQRQER